MLLYSPLRCANRIAIALGLLRAVPLMLTTLPTLSGNNHPAARLCMAPMEDPTLAYSRSMPRWSSRQNCARTMSKMESTGKRVAYGSPVVGSIEEGPVEP